MTMEPNHTAAVITARRIASMGKSSGSDGLDQMARTSSQHDHAAMYAHAREPKRRNALMDTGTLLTPLPWRRGTVVFASKNPWVGGTKGGGRDRTRSLDRGSGCWTIPHDRPAYHRRIPLYVASARANHAVARQDRRLRPCMARYRPTAPASWLCPARPTALDCQLGPGKSQDVTDK